MRGEASARVSLSLNIAEPGTNDDWVNKSEQMASLPKTLGQNSTHFAHLTINRVLLAWNRGEWSSNLKLILISNSLYAGLYTYWIYGLGYIYIVEFRYELRIESVEYAIWAD